MYDSTIVRCRKIHWVSWERLCLPRQFGGLGLVDFKVKNKALLYIWLWRYGSERNRLWHRVINAKYEKGENHTLPVNTSARNKPWIWCGIVRPLSLSNVDSNPFASHVHVRVGDGSSLDFWSDNWVNRSNLKTLFPRIFALAVKKEGKIREFGHWLQGCWVWNCLRWDLSSSGCFESKDIINLAYENVNQNLLWKSFWYGLVPNNIEHFAWRVLINRVPTKVELLKRGVSLVETSCVLRKNEIETIDHLFFSCEVSWRIWCSWIGLSVKGVFHNLGYPFFEAWLGYCPSSKIEPFWKMTFFSVLWSIWCCGNGVIFNQETWEDGKVLDSIWLKLRWWSKANWSDISFTINEFISKPADSVAVRSSWVAPGLDVVKFNTDGEVSGNFGPAGIGGLLANHKGDCLIQFSKSIGFADPFSAEILAIKEACSFAAVQWLNNPLLAPSGLRVLVDSCKDALIRSGGSILWIGRDARTDFVFEIEVAQFILVGLHCWLFSLFVLFEWCWMLEFENGWGWFGARAKVLLPECWLVYC
ncbi:hypothetical protein F3Y22_tig00110597pilonHSYRG00143 [Hibiscus syriacus]|uniref:Reverse transcriptase zinc-binding domain-containing protein n=1 Tax=Hibiscus syriacus TaxID=106335 RepID=A0A6A3A297_HIBSY|nr:hypothetical protein F3Y22_tig00110597pilonHSYRG00143 [Hibiscus syriacus]